MLCTKCGLSVDDQDNYCRFCGSFLKDNAELPWHYRPWVIYPAIVIFGPLSLPLVFKNPSLNRTKKNILTFIIILYTCVLLTLPAFVINHIYKKVLGSGCY